MPYPKPITLKSLTAAREPLLAEKIDPAQPVMAEGFRRTGKGARWLDRRAFSNAALVNWLRSSMIAPNFGNAEEDQR